MVFVPRTPCGGGIETRLLGYQVVTYLEVSGTFLLGVEYGRAREAPPDERGGNS